MGEKVSHSGVDLLVTRKADGAIILDNAIALPPMRTTLPGRLKEWAQTRPEAIFLSEADRLLTYAEAEQQRALLAGKLLARGVTAETGVLILGDNGINHALVMLAATSVGIPVAVVSPAYIHRASAPWTKFGRVVKQFNAGLIFADRPEVVGQALSDLGEVFVVLGLKDLAELEGGNSAPDSDLATAEANVGADTVSKLLFTSGSTGIPKAVPNTQRMMVSNMQAIEIIWPFLAERPPVMVDWLPWNHTFGGNCCFDIALWFGGRMHIDQGKPTPILFGKTVESIRQVQPTVYFSTPLGYELLNRQFELDRSLAEWFFKKLEFAFNAGAALPANIRQNLTDAWEGTTGGKATIVGGWGSTETAPFATVLPFDTPHASNLGVPIPGTTIKLVPDAEEGRYEMRVRGPNVMPGYWQDEAATASAFDDDGYYCIGDAGRFIDPHNAAAGILFDGRVAENFKLSSGTFVNVGALRLAVIAACEGLVSDAVIAGEGRSQIGVLLFPNRANCLQYLGLDDDQSIGCLSESEQLCGHLHALLNQLKSASKGSSTRPSCFLLLDESPSPADDEITDKGYLNQRRILDRRADAVDALYRPENSL